MAENRTPREGQVYADPEGRPVLFVRTERRNGAEAPEHFFVSTRDRTVFHRWFAEAPPELELALDPEATARADALEAELIELRAERAALVAAMQRAVGTVSVPIANDLRRVYRETLGATLTRGDS